MDIIASGQSAEFLIHVWRFRKATNPGYAFELHLD